MSIERGSLPSQNWYAGDDHPLPSVPAGPRAHASGEPLIIGDSGSPNEITAPMSVVRPDASTGATNPEAPYIWRTPEEVARANRTAEVRRGPNIARLALLLGGFCVTFATGIIVANVRPSDNNRAPSTANVAAKTYTPGTPPTHVAASPTVTATPAKTATPAPTKAPTAIPSPTATQPPAPTQPPASGNIAYTSSGGYEVNKDGTSTNQYDAPGEPETVVCTINIGGTPYAEFSDGKFFLLAALSRKPDQYNPLNPADYPSCG